MKRNTDINELLHPLDEEPIQGIITNALQVADILEWILDCPEVKRTCGKTTVYQTTFSISEEFLRRIYTIKRETGARFEVIIDRKSLNKTVQLWQMISRVYDKVWLSDNHSKILIVDHPALRACMVTSQNLTRGNRAESSVITTEPAVWNSLMRDYEDLQHNHSAPMHELMNVPERDSTENVCGAAHSGENLTPEDETDVVESIKRLAGCFATISDIAIILDVNPSELRDRIADPDSPEGKAYRVGKTQAKLALKAQEMELAKIGSPIAMQTVKENLLLMESDED